MTVVAAPTTFAEAEVVLASRLPGYESRPQQQRMAAFVEQILGSKEPTQGLAEAGCGVGKSLGAMIPAILSGKRVVVATATIALMSQYASKDIPFLAEHLGVPFTWALLKGRSNYLCESKMASPSEHTNLDLVARLRAEVEADPEHSGDFEDFETPMTKAEFSLLTTSGVECPGKRKCPFGAVCFAERAKRKAAMAQVVVTNSAMLMTDLKVREWTDGKASMLGEFDALILDEAHELEEIATSQLEEVFRPGGVTRLVKEVVNYAAAQGADTKAGPAVEEALAAVTASLPDPGREKVRLGMSFFVQHADAYVGMIDALRDLFDDVTAVTIERDEQRARDQRERLTSRITNQIRKWSDLLTAEESDLVRWVEMDTVGRTPAKVLHNAPINVAPFLTEWLWSTTTALLTSATLSVGGNFDFIKTRLGLNDAATTSVGTPFNYERQALLFVPAATVPSPKNRSAWMTYAGAATRELVTASGGGALLLFTSRTAMTESYNALAPSMREQGLTTLMQGLSGTNKEIARTFKEDVHSVLFALKSFFTGVDIPGEALRLVIIDKLPFPVPSEPVFQARADQIKRAGGSDFNRLSMPLMSLTLVQAYGRLIRTKDDRGVVAILDSRLTSTGYGRTIVGSLPDSPATTSLDDVRAFFAA